MKRSRDDILGADMARGGDVTSGRQGTLRSISTLKALAIRGSFWALSGHGVIYAMRFVSNIILTRLLFPEVFGLMALVAVVLQGLEMFSDIGIGPSIIQNKRGDEPVFLNTAWTIQVARGFLLWLCACAIAHPVAWFYAQNDPALLQLTILFPIVGLTALIAGFNSIGLFTQNRHLALGRLTLVDLVSQGLGMGTMLCWALIHRSIWALVAGALARSIVKLLLSHLCLPGIKHRLQWDSEAGRTLFDFGKWIFLSTLLTFLALQADRLIFGRMIPLEMLAVYHIGLTIAMMPSEVLNRLSSSVIFPLYSHIYHQNNPLLPVVARVRTPILLTVGSVLALLMVIGPSLIQFLYDTRYAEAGWILQFLAAGSWFMALETMNRAALLASGQTRWLAVGNGVKVIGMTLTITLGYFLFGFPGAVAGIASAEFFKYAMSAFAMQRTGLVGWPQDVLLTLHLTLTASGVWSVTYYLDGQGVPTLIVCATAGLVATMLSGSSLACYWFNGYKWIRYARVLR